MKLKSEQTIKDSSCDFIIQGKDSIVPNAKRVIIQNYSVFASQLFTRAIALLRRNKCKLLNLVRKYQ